MEGKGKWGKSNRSPGGQGKGPVPQGGRAFPASKPVSRVLSFKTAIYLDAPLPMRSSHLQNAAGPALTRYHGVAPDRVYSDEQFPVIGRALISAFPPLPRGRMRQRRPAPAPPEGRGGISLLHFS